MSVSHSAYAVYGVAIAPPREPMALDEALAAQAHRPAEGNHAQVRVQLFTIGDSEHTILGAGYERSAPTRTGQFPPCRSAPSGTTPCLSS